MTMGCSTLENAQFFALEEGFPGLDAQSPRAPDVASPAFPTDPSVRPAEQYGKRRDLVPSVRSLELYRMSRRAVAELQEYVRFDAGWDGYRGERFAPTLVARAAAFVRDATEFLEHRAISPTEITPGPASDGTVDIEIVVAGRQLVMTFDPDTAMVRAYASSGNQDAEQTIQLDGSPLERHLRWLAGEEGFPRGLGSD